jgi:hypothetical protein
MIPELRLSPDHTEIALRWPGRKYWTIYGRETFEALVSDEQVADWTPFVLGRHVQRVTCPWCERDGRSLNDEGRIRWHYGRDGSYWSSHCPGTGRLPTEYETPAERSA